MESHYLIFQYNLEFSEWKNASKQLEGSNDVFQNDQVYTFTFEKKPVYIYSFNFIHFNTVKLYFADLQRFIILREIL